MNRKVYLTITARVILNVPEGMEIQGEVVPLLDLYVTDDKIEIVDFNVEEAEVTDSK